MEKLDYNMEDYKVITLAGGSILSMEVLGSLLIIGQPYVNGVIGILTVIYLIKKIFQKDKNNINLV